MMQGLSRSTRRIARRVRRKRSTELNIVSMIDILTVLVFFLLVNATGVSILGINLPSSQATPDQKQHRDLKVIIRQSDLLLADSQGAIKDFPNNQRGYDLDSLAALLIQIKDRLPPDETSIKLLSEPNISYDVLVQVMDAVRVDPGGNGRAPRDLFPEISMGDAPTNAPAGASP